MEPVDPTTASEGLSWLREINLLQGVGLAVFLIFMIIYVAAIVRIASGFGMIYGFFGAFNAANEPGGSILEGDHLEVLAISFLAFILSNFIVRRIAKHADDDS